MVRQRMGGKDVCSSAPFSTVRLEHKRITRKTQPASFASVSRLRPKALAENVVDYSSVAAYAKHFLLFHWFLFVKESEVVIHCSRPSQWRAGRGFEEISRKTSAIRNGTFRL
jgi:hypothetical protein